MIFRVIACLLGLGGVVWGLTFALFLSIYGNRLITLLLAPGYFLTVTYFWRALGDPSRTVRIAIWGVSTLYEGFWIVGAVCGVLFRHQSIHPTISWTLLSFLLSLIGLCLDDEPRKPLEHHS